MINKKTQRRICLLLATFLLVLSLPAALAEEEPVNSMLFQGHGSFRFTTREGKVIYLDPASGEGYDLPADLILVTHAHSDHARTDLIKNRNEGCTVITWKEALAGGTHQVFDLGFVKVEAVEAGNNKNHKLSECVGFILTFSDGVTFYASGDTSATEQMKTFAGREIDYAALCCDGKFNMGIEEAAACAELIAAKHTMPCHMKPGALFDRACADKFASLVENAWIVEAGEEVVLVK